MKSIGDAANRTLELHPSRFKWAAVGSAFLSVAIAIGVLTATGPAITREGAVVLWAFAALFGGAAALSFMMVMPGLAFLLLTPQGFTVRTPIAGTKNFRWGEVEAFYPITTGGASWVAFKLSPPAKAVRFETMLGGLSKALNGGDGNLLDPHGMSAEELAELMNRWKKRSAGAAE